MYKKRTNTNASMYKYKFILLKIKKLIFMKNRLFIDEFDKVFYDVFGMKNVGRKMVNIRRNSDYIRIIDMLGVQNLLRLCNNRETYEAMKMLIVLNGRMGSTRKAINKMRKKGKRDKSLVKEYNYYIDTYKKGVKSVKRVLGIKNNKTLYKREFDNLSSFIKSSKDDDDYGILGFDDNDDFFDRSSYSYGGYDDDEDDYDDRTELEDFMTFDDYMGTKSRRPSKRRRPSDDDDFDDMMSSFEDDDEEDDEEDTYQSEMIDKLNSKTDRLEDMISNLVSNLSAVSMQNNQMMNNARRQNRVNEYYDRKATTSPVQHQPRRMSEPVNSAVMNEIGSMKRDYNQLAQTLQNISDNQQAMSQLIAEAFSDDGYDDYEEEPMVRGQFASPVIDESNPIMERANKYPDLYEEMAEEEPDPEPVRRAPSPNQPPRMSREEMIEQINRSTPLEHETLENTEDVGEQ